MKRKKKKEDVGEHQDRESHDDQGRILEEAEVLQKHAFFDVLERVSLQSVFDDDGASHQEEEKRDDDPSEEAAHFVREGRSLGSRLGLFHLLAREYVLQSHFVNVLERLA